MFLLVPLSLAAVVYAPDEHGTIVRAVVLVAVCLVLAPKNYVFYGHIGRPASLQIVLNPAILLAAALLVLAYFAYGRSGGKLIS